MINWLIQNSATYPELASGNCPDGLLNAAERRHLTALRTPKRRREWLLGRLTAKHLLQMLIEQECGESTPFEELTIINAPNGAPLVSGPCFEHAMLSISHREDYAFCAARVQDLAHLGERCALGVDIELVEPRLATFADDYFTESERQLLSRAAEAMRDLLITAIWSAKEAALKAAHVGLNVDTRAVSCRIAPVQEPPQVWTPFQINWDAPRLLRQPPMLIGWWRVQGEFVLTLATNPGQDMQPNLQPINDGGRTTVVPPPSHFEGVFA